MLTEDFTCISVDITDLCNPKVCHLTMPDITISPKPLHFYDSVFLTLTWMFFVLCVNGL
jgi:hypothetical protein